MKTIVLRILSLILFFLMLLFPADTLSGAGTGLLLWFQTVLPTLLPCMIAADFLLRIGAERFLARFLLRPLARILQVSQDGAYAAFVGFLCGYPIGARTASSLLVENRISRREASYLLSFSNQPSPMFVTGYLCVSLLAGKENRISLIPCMLTGVYGSALAISLLYRLLRKMNRQLCRSTAVPAYAPLSSDTEFSREPVSAHDPMPHSTEKTAGSSPLALLERSMMTSFEVMVKIGGYMMLFSIAEVFLLKLPVINCPAGSLLLGLVEMTTGSQHIADRLSMPWAAAFCCAAAATGGLSGLAQTQNVLQGSGLSAGQYFLWKLLQGALACGIVILWFFFAGAYPALP